MEERLAALEAKVDALEAILWRHRLLLGQLYYASTHGAHAQDEADAIEPYGSMGQHDLDIALALVNRVYQLDL